VQQISRRSQARGTAKIIHHSGDIQQIYRLIFVYIRRAITGLSSPIVEDFLLIIRVNYLIQIYICGSTGGVGTRLQTEERQRSQTGEIATARSNVKPVGVSDKLTLAIPGDTHLSDTHVGKNEASLGLETSKIKKKKKKTTGTKKNRPYKTTDSLTHHANIVVDARWGWGTLKLLRKRLREIRPTRREGISEALQENNERRHE
jgi:hypothetical protein